MTSRPESTADPDRYSMRTISFPEWLQHRLEQVPDAMTLALVIARSGVAGVSREEIGRAMGVSFRSNRTASASDGGGGAGGDDATERTAHVPGGGMKESLQP